MQTEFYTNLNKKVDVILFFIYWTWTYTCHAQIYWGGGGGGGEGCLVALRKMLPDIVIPQQKKIIALGGMINIFVKTPHLLYS